MRILSHLLPFVAVTLSPCWSFTPPIQQSKLSLLSRTLPQSQRQQPGCSSASSTQLSIGGAIIDVPDGFFTLTFPLLGIMLQISKQVNRARLEERAFDLRLKEARERRLEQDPSLTESELIRQEAAQDVSYYGPDAMARREAKESTRASSSTKRVTVLERTSRRKGERRFTLSDDEVADLEAMGVEYDPYYDDPYTEDELPDDENYRQDKRYGDRIFDDGEIFYKDSDTGLYYRQGAKPRISNFWAGSRN